MTSLQNIDILGVQGLPDVDGIEKFDKNNQAAKQYFYVLNILGPGHLYQNFWSHQHQEILSTKISIFCSEVMMIKILILGGFSRHF